MSLSLRWRRRTRKRLGDLEQSTVVGPPSNPWMLFYLGFRLVTFPFWLAAPQPHISSGDLVYVRAESASWEADTRICGICGASSPNPTLAQGS